MAVHRNWLGAVKRHFIVRVRRSSASSVEQNRCSMRLGSNLVEGVRRRFSKSTHPQKPSIVFNHTNNRETFTNDEDVDEEEKEQTNSQEHIIEYSEEGPVAVVDGGDDGGFATASASASSPSQDFLSLKEDLAAIMIQASFRGHLARRAYRALRSLVRLQAVVRGAQVRSQARIALNCMHALVRLQRRIRDRQVLSMSSPELSCQV